MKGVEDMKTRLAISCAALSLQMLNTGCDLGNTPQHDPQDVRIQFQYGFRNMVDTFNGTLTKDLALDGTISTSFWLTKTEQKVLMAELQQEDFFHLPDTLLSTPGVSIYPDPSPDFLRVAANGEDKTVVWFHPVDVTDPHGQTIQRLSEAVRAIIEATSEYKELPAARGGYI
jgi:hypothetical protein